MGDNLTMLFFCLQTFSGLPLLLAVTSYGYHGYYHHSSPSDVVPASFSSLIFYCSQLYLNTPYPYLSVFQISLPLGFLTCFFLCLEHTPLLYRKISQKGCPTPCSFSVPTLRPLIFTHLVTIFTTFTNSLLFAEFSKHFSSYLTLPSFMIPSSRMHPSLGHLWFCILLLLIPMFLVTFASLVFIP